MYWSKHFLYGDKSRFKSKGVNGNPVKSWIFFLLNFNAIIRFFFLKKTPLTSLGGAFLQKRHISPQSFHRQHRVRRALAPSKKKATFRPNPSAQRFVYVICINRRLLSSGKSHRGTSSTDIQSPTSEIRGTRVDLA